MDETGSAEIQKIAGTGSTFVSDATHGQVLNVHHNLYRIDSATLGAMLDANAFTISFWIRLKEFGSDVMNANLLLSRYDWNVGDNRGGFILWINAKKIALKQYYGPNTTPHEVESTQELSILDNWYHIMLVKVSSTESKIFIDGTLDNSFTFSPAAKSMHNPMDVIGLGVYCYGNTGNADGYSCAVGSSYDDNSKYYMTDLRFYDFAASDTQVAAIANGGNISPCSSSVASPQNITFLVSVGNVSAGALAPHHPAILSAVTTSLGTALSQMGIISVADAAHNAANLHLVAADVPGADVDALSQKTDEVAAAVKDAVNSAAGGSAVVCAAKAATIVGTGADLAVYC